MKNLHYYNRIRLKGASHRIVVVIDPTTVKGGIKLIDETYTLIGSSSTINASLSIRVE